MDQNYTNPAGGTDGKKISTPLIIVIVIVVLAALGGFYYWKNYQAAPAGGTTSGSEAAGNAENSVADIETGLGAIDTAAPSDLNQLETQF